MLPLTVAVSASSPTRPLTPYSGQLCAAPSYVNVWLSAVTVTGCGLIFRPPLFFVMSYALVTSCVPFVTVTMTTSFGTVPSATFFTLPLTVAVSTSPFASLWLSPAAIFTGSPSPTCTV